MNRTEHELELIRRYSDGVASLEETQELESLIVKDASMRQDFLRYTHLDSALAGVRRSQPSVVVPRPSVWLSWRPLTAAAAGIVFGLFSATLVWAYVAPFSDKSVMLLQESFESSSSPLVTHVPLEPGVWLANYAEVVTKQQGVRPATGKKMLRFLKADTPGKPRPLGGHLAAVYRLIDLRQYRHELIDSCAVVQASANLNATPFPEDQKFGCAISLFALDADSVPDSASYIGTALETDANAMARSSRTNLDRDPMGWQRLTTEMRLPANTEFLVVRLHINQLFGSDGTSVFTGSYADDVRVTLSSRPPLP